MSRDHLPPGRVSVLNASITSALSPEDALVAHRRACAEASGVSDYAACRVFGITLGTVLSKMSNPGGN